LPAAHPEKRRIETPGADNHFDFPLLSDTNMQVAVAYGAADDHSAPAAKRIAALVDERGKILKIYKKVKPAEVRARRPRKRDLGLSALAGATCSPAHAARCASSSRRRSSPTSRRTSSERARRARRARRRDVCAPCDVMAAARKR
jgi:hypothetical protein